eukprot:4056142-Pleurochrysis_carterae.AAC.3
MAFQETKTLTTGARRAMCDNPLMKYAAQATVVACALELSTDAHIASAWRAVVSGLQVHGALWSVDFEASETTLLVRYKYAATCFRVW